jgi:hypothetical protein
VGSKKQKVARLVKQYALPSLLEQLL